MNSSFDWYIAIAVIITITTHHGCLEILALANAASPRPRGARGFARHGDQLGLQRKPVVGDLDRQSARVRPAV